jgi:hypothetical protein
MAGRSVTISLPEDLVAAIDKQVGEDHSELAAMETYAWVRQLLEEWIGRITPYDCDQNEAPVPP